MLRRAAELPTACGHNSSETLWSSKSSGDGRHERMTMKFHATAIAALCTLGFFHVSQAYAVEFLHDSLPLRASLQYPGSHWARCFAWSWRLAWPWLVFPMLVPCSGINNGTALTDAKGKVPNWSFDGVVIQTGGGRRGLQRPGSKAAKACRSWNMVFYLPKGKLSCWSPSTSLVFFIQIIILNIAKVDSDTTKKQHPILNKTFKHYIWYTSIKNR